ncbi:MAG TPA: adenosylcobinamide kinase [Lachnospiraceae bacterium]|nr:adenosylcobinamide kinase [Lachnospiraceae bacterium]
MILVIGGAFQGKQQFARDISGLEDWADGRTCGEEELDTCSGMIHFHEYIRNRLAKGQDCTGIAERVARTNPNVVLVANELGCGVVPMDAFDRRYRETVGRICTGLAAEAEAVYRVVCGIGVKIK